MRLGERLDLRSVRWRRAPGEHRLGQDVVEDLVAHVAALLERAQDPSLGEGVERPDAAPRRDAPEVREVRDLVRDLRPGRRDEVVEEARGDVLLLRRELLERTLQMLLDDVLCASEPLERLRAERVRARSLAPRPRSAA